MCELLVRVVDKVNAKDPDKDARCLKRGDVVVICEDGHQWSKRELANPSWRVIKLPGTNRREVQHLMYQEVGADRRVGMSRAFKVDVDHISIRSQVESAKEPVALQKAALDAVVVLKPGITDPRLDPATRAKSKG